MLYQRGRAYSPDLRNRVFAASDDGERVGEVADLLRVSVPYVSKVLSRRRNDGGDDGWHAARPQAAEAGTVLHGDP